MLFKKKAGRYTNISERLASKIIQVLNFGT